MTKIGMRAIDLATGRFQVRGVGAVGAVPFNKAMSRPRLHQLLADQLPCTVALAADAAIRWWRDRGRGPARQADHLFGRPRCRQDRRVAPPIRGPRPPEFRMGNAADKRLHGPYRWRRRPAGTDGGGGLTRMAVEIALPAQFTADRLFPIIGKRLAHMEDVPERVAFDFSRLNFVRPSGIVFLSNLVRYLERSGCHVSFVQVDMQRDAIRFLDGRAFLRAARRLKAQRDKLAESDHAPCHGDPAHLLSWLA